MTFKEYARIQKKRERTYTQNNNKYGKRVNAHLKSEIPTIQCYTRFQPVTMKINKQNCIENERDTDGVNEKQQKLQKKK